MINLTNIIKGFITTLTVIFWQVHSSQSYHVSYKLYPLPHPILLVGYVCNCCFIFLKFTNPLQANQYNCIQDNASQQEDIIICFQFSLNKISGFQNNNLT